MRVGFDIDGVLANFVAAYQKLFVEVTGRDAFHTGDDVNPPSWNWPTERGYTKDETNAVWKRIVDSDEFWFNLDAMEPNITALRDAYEILDANHELYFVTSRPGLHAKHQTEEWLCQKLQVIDKPTVLIAGHRVKGLVCKALNLDAYVDDNYDNVMDCVLDSPRTHTYLLNARYNTGPKNTVYTHHAIPAYTGADVLVAADRVEAHRIPDLATFLHHESLLG